MYIDIHAHAFLKHPRGIPGLPPFCTPEELLRTYDKLNIEKGFILPIVSPEIYLPQSNEDVLDICAKYPDRLIPFCNVDPRALTNSPDAPLDAVLQYYKDRGCRGVGEIMPNLAVMDPKVQNLFRHAEKVGLPVTTDGSDQLTNDFGLYDDPGLPQLEHTLQRFPKLTFFGHGPVFWAEIARLETPASRGFIYDLNGHQVGRLPTTPVTEEGVVPKLLRAYPNLHGDLSDFTAYNAIARDPEYGPKFLTEFQDRLCFGTDMCFEDMPTPLPALLEDWLEKGKISQEVFDKIAWKNAVRIFHLED